SAFQPPKRLLMGPGPSDVAPSVLKAMSAPLVGHLDPVFVKMMEEIKAMLRVVFQTKNEMTFPVSGTGSAGMEFCFVNLIEPGDGSGDEAEEESAKLVFRCELAGVVLGARAGLSSHRADHDELRAARGAAVGLAGRAGKSLASA